MLKKLFRKPSKTNQNMWEKPSAYTHVVKSFFCLCLNVPLLNIFSVIFHSVFTHKNTINLGVVWGFPYFPHNLLINLKIKER